MDSESAMTSLTYYLIGQDVAKLREISNLSIYEYFQALEMKLTVDAKHSNQLRNNPNGHR